MRVVSFTSETSVPDDGVTDVSVATGIIDDLAAFQELCAEDPERALEVSDSWLQFPHPSGRGHMLVGPGVRPKLINLTERALSDSALQDRVDFDEAFRTLMKEFARRFVTEANVVDEPSVSSLLRFVASEMSARLADWEIYIPVRFAFQTDDVRIRLGDVELLPRPSLKRELRNDIRSYLAEAGVEDRPWRKLEVKYALEYYASYKWAAKVRLFGCDQPTALKSGKEVLLSAIDCLHVVFGRSLSSRLRIGDLKISFDQRATAYRKLDGHIQLSSSRGTLDVLGLPDDWATWLDQPEIEALLELSGIALETRSRFEDSRSLALRYLDCARWFGEAVRDAAPFSKIVKYVTAIERGVVAGTSRSVKRTVATRVSNLLYSTLDGVGWQDTYDDVLAIYALRSDLVHGSVSPFSDSVGAGLRRCGELAENTLRVLLLRLSNEGLLARDVSEAEYADWFKRSHEYVMALRDEEVAKAQ
jgi:hypothetical protein